jgi:hypothetical protein
VIEEVWKQRQAAKATSAGGNGNAAPKTAAKPAAVH